MSLILNLLYIYTPAGIKKNKIYGLFKITADAFEIKMPESDFNKVSTEKLLVKYALFTKAEAEKFLKTYGNDRDKLTGLQNRLYEKSYAMGKEIRKNLKIKGPEEAVKALKLIYRIIKINFKKEKNGVVEIDKCFFSSYYDSYVCDLISSLDKGIAAGVSGDCRLEFFQRITDGKNCCKAFFDI